MAADLSNSEILSRQQCLDNLEEYINKCQTDISSMLDEMNWSPDHFIQPRNRATCKHNEGHKMPQGSLSTHEQQCELTSQGCSKEQAEQILTDLAYPYQGSSCVYTESLDIEKLNAVLWNYHVKNSSVFYGYKKMPLTPDQEEEMLSREDRLGLAEFIISKAKEAKKLKELGIDQTLVSENLADLVRKEGEVRDLAFVEELAAMRDYKRRRQTYRAKNVHITKKSHTEILREVITNQMEMYAKSIEDQSDASQDKHRYERSGSYDSGALPDRQDRRRSRSRERPRDSEGRDRVNRSDRAESRDRYGESEGRDRVNRSDRAESRDRYGESEGRDRVNRSDRAEGRDRYGESEVRDRHRWDRADSRDKMDKKDRSRRRSRSGSSDRHKKHKHKKHKHKHKKHKRGHSDVEEKSDD